MSNQRLSKEKLEEISVLETENPDTVEQAVLKRRWTYVTKDPSKAVKDSQVSNSYWGSLNHIPPE